MECDRRATFVHGVYDAARNVNTELANVADWLPLTVILNGERFSMNRGTIEGYCRTLNMRNGLLTRTVHWRSPSGERATLIFERFASLAQPHLLCLRCRVCPEFEGTIEFRTGIEGHTDNLGVTHFNWVDQGVRDSTAFLRTRTRQSNIEIAYALQALLTSGKETERAYWDAECTPWIVVKAYAKPHEEIILDKRVTLYTSREVPADKVVLIAVDSLHTAPEWDAALEENEKAWNHDWERTDVLIEGDNDAQRALRFNIFELLIAAPRHDARVSIGAKTLSGFGYRGHVFWDTEIFMLPPFTLTYPDIARNLLEYRYGTLEGARQKARSNGFEGAQFAWESADTGEEVTPTWIPDTHDRVKLVRIWTGEIEIHISADIAYAVHQYWLATGDDKWMIEKGAELILDTAKFWGSRAEYNAKADRYEYNNVIGPDEYHDHVNNNAYTNEMARWNLRTAFEVLDWLRKVAPGQADSLISKLDLTPTRLAHWADVIEKMYVPMLESGLIEQFDGYFALKDVDLKSLDPRVHSAQHILGIDGVNKTQIIKQPDVLMLLFLLRNQYSDEIIRINYDYYTPRTDHAHGSSLGPAIQSIMACEVGEPVQAYTEFWRAARADLYDVRGNAGDGIHGASAGGVWQSVILGFAGLHISNEGWTMNSRLPHDWRRLAFKFFYHNSQVSVDLPLASAPSAVEPELATEGDRV